MAEIPFDGDRMTRDEAAAYLGFSRGTLEVDACTRQLGVPFYKLGRRVFYRRSDLNEWIESRRIAKRRPRSTLTTRAA